MSKLKSFDEFVNENLVTKGEYNFYGPGSLNPIIKKLIGEGKNESIIRTYLTSLGVVPWRIDKAFAELSEVEIAIVSGKEVNEGKKKMTFEEKATKLLKDINEEEDEVSENRSKEKDPYSQGYDDREDESIGARTGSINLKDFGSDDKAEALKADRDDSYGKFGKRDEEHPDQHIDKAEESVVAEAKKKTFEEAAAAFLLGLKGSDAIDEEDEEKKVDEKLNKETLQVEGDGEDIDDMIDDLEDGDEDEDQGPDDDAPDSDVEKKIKDGESPADAAEGDSDDAKDKIKNAAEELAKDSEKLDKIKKVLGETKEVTLDDDGKEVEDKEDIEDEETGDDIQVEESVKEDKYLKAVTEGLKTRFGK